MAQFALCATDCHNFKFYLCFFSSPECMNGSCLHISIIRNRRSFRFQPKCGEYWISVVNVTSCWYSPYMLILLFFSEKWTVNIAYCVQCCHWKVCVSECVLFFFFSILTNYLLSNVFYLHYVMHFFLDSQTKWLKNVFSSKWCNVMLFVFEHLLNRPTKLQSFIFCVSDIDYFPLWNTSISTH